MLKVKEVVIFQERGHASLKSRVYFCDLLEKQPCLFGPEMPWSFEHSGKDMFSLHFCEVT